MKIEIGDKEYDVSVARTEEEKEKGLQNQPELSQGEGMLFEYDEPQTVGFWMEDTMIPLDVVFIDDAYEVIAVHHGEPLSTEIMQEDNVLYVLEVNRNSGIQVGDELILEDEDSNDKMQVIGPDGQSQMELEGGERIFSRKNTRTLVKMAKRAYTSDSDRDYKALGKKAFKYLDTQDSNKPEYVETP